jgi:LmbE family N-acetylglucosaminyl deacetylase
MIVISPHPDDSVLGAGGIMARFIKYGGKVTVLTFAVHSPPLFSQETKNVSLEEVKKAHAVLGVKNSIFLNYSALSLAKVDQQEINRELLSIIKKINPNILLLPFLDRNTDHRVLFESGMVASRPVSKGMPIIVASYEVLSSSYYNAPYIEPNFIPAWTVDISEFIEMKINAVACCETHIGTMPHPRSCEAVRSLAVFRGSQAGMNYGESFYLSRMTANPDDFIKNELQLQNI